jgi:putative ABC transport system permease protein
LKRAVEVEAMTLPLAWANLLHQKTRTAVAIAGVAFALILIFMQLGFLGAVKDTATLIYRHLDFDLLLVSSQYGDIYRPGTFARDRLELARSLPEVERATPVYVGFQLWRNPEPPRPNDPADWGHRRRIIMMLAFDPAEPVFARPIPAGDPHAELPGEEPSGAHAELCRPDTVLIDSLSRKEFGPPPAVQDGVLHPTEVELGRRRVEVVGRFKLGTSFGADGLVVTSPTTYARIVGRPLDQVCLGLIKLRPGEDRKAAQAKVAGLLREKNAGDVRVLTRDQIEEREQQHWVQGTSVGIIFNLGVFVALVVGIVFVYQVISGDIANHASEYATLKAMGYSGTYLSGVVLQQAVLLALLAYLPSLVASWGLYDMTWWATAIPMNMTAQRAAGVLALALFMCSVSGLFALRKVRAADPADLF